jgi:hypothetical protein
VELFSDAQLAVLRAQAVAAAVAGARELLRHLDARTEALLIRAKPDGSPVSAADFASHRAILASLAPTGIPVISEEGDLDAPSPEGKIDGAGPSLTWPRLAAGASSPDVTTLQYLLTWSGFPTARNGVFDAATATAVRAFQRSRSLAPDAVVFTATWGDGDAPASARGALERIAEAAPRAGVPMVVLGFGDRSFPGFCAFAEAVLAGEMEA